jgi:hypothetical protein
VRGISIPRQADPSTSAGASNHPAHLTLCCLGARHPGSIPSSARGLSLPLHRYRQVYQVGGGGAGVHHTGQVRSQVHLWPGLPFWCA